MGSKLEYWFLLTKIAVVVLDVMILKKMASALSSQRLSSGSCGMLVVGSLFYLPSQTHQFSKVQFPIGFGFWIFQFTESPSLLPEIHPIANLLSSKLNGGNWKIQKTPNCPKFSQFTQKSPNFQHLKA